MRQNQHLPSLSGATCSHHFSSGYLSPGFQPRSHRFRSGAIFRRRRGVCGPLLVFLLKMPVNVCADQLFHNVHGVDWSIRKIFEFERHKVWKQCHCMSPEKGFCIHGFDTVLKTRTGFYAVSMNFCMLFQMCIPHLLNEWRFAHIMMKLRQLKIRIKMV